MSEHTKTLIIGSGPAGYTAAIYAARANLSPVLVQGMQPGGQLTITTDVENYPGFADVIQGPWLMEQMQKQAEHVGTKVVYDHVTEVDFSKRPFTAKTENGVTLTADTVIVATGAQAKWLGLPDEEHYRGFGVSGCATCDGFFFKNREVVVVGGGNTALEEAQYLTNHASKVTLVHRRDSFRAEKILQKRVFANPKIEIAWNAELAAVAGKENPRAVTAAVLRDTRTGETREVPCEGIFIAIGHSPNTALFKDRLELDAEGYIVTRPGTAQTSVPGVFACGDVQDKIYRQAVTAAGTGCMAALDAEKFIAGHAA